MTNTNRALYDAYKQFKLASVPSSLVCMHGYGIPNCAICHKRQGECDFGDCQEAATQVVIDSGETRLVCEKHAQTLRAICAGWECIDDELTEDGTRYTQYAIRHICGHETIATYRGVRRAGLDIRADEESMHVCEACQ